MSQPIRSHVKFTKSPHFFEGGGKFRRADDDFRERDNRPGHYSIVGSFIKLPDSSAANADDERKER